MSLGEGASKHIEVSNEKISLVYFSFPSGSIFPEIKEGL